MRKLRGCILFCLTAALTVGLLGLWEDHTSLEEDLIRLHVVAVSDSPQDQENKLKVRDAVLSSIQEAMASLGDAKEAERYLLQNLPRIEEAANRCLEALGCEDRATVTLCREAFEKRVYDTFTLPAGIYQALRVTIGEGRGHNWWCVAFPALCLPAVSREVEAVAADAGLSPALTGAITGQYRLRFCLLDLLGSMKTHAAP